MRLKNKNVLFFTKLIVFGALFMMILPFILFGENNYITVHDNLDQFPPFWSIAKKVGLFSFDVSTGVMDNTPAVYFGWGGFTIQNFAYYLLPAYATEIDQAGITGKMAKSREVNNRISRCSFPNNIHCNLYIEKKPTSNEIK